ncbi:MAG: tetratricopeptide repeat protein [Nitrospiraceae bacterium]|nr:MAG: tetratricopeptide repeat protein [Nitrospiraceae bacterium]
MSSGGPSSDSARGSFHMTASPFVQAILIALVCLVSYSNTFHVPFQFDDPYNISEKPYVRDISLFFDTARFSPDSSFIMRTVTYFTLAVNYWIHGTNVAGYHVVNILIHMFNGFLVYFLLLFSFRTQYFVSQGLAVSSNPPSSPLKLRGDEGGLFSSRFIPLAAALLFVSHPIQTQAVTYIVQRLASLATLFYLLSLVMYIKWRLSSVGAGLPRPYSFIYYLLSLISAILAMKTKEVAFTLPLVIALYEFLFFTGAFKKRLLSLLPFMLTMLIIPVSLMSIGKPTGEIIGDVSEVARVETDISRWEYLFTQFRVIVTYIRLLFFPVNQNLDYDYTVYRTFFDPNVILSFLFLLAIFGIGVYCLYRSRIDNPGNPAYRTGRHRGIAPTTHLRLVAFGIFWFFITLSVESSIIPIADVIFEHRLYLPSVGFFIAVTAVVSMVLERVSNISKGWAKIAVAMLGLIVVILSAGTYLRNNVWQSEVTLWEDVAKKSPMRARSYNGLGLAYQKGGRLDEALKSFQQAVALDPYYAVAHNSLGTILFKKNLFDLAAEEFSIAISLDPENAIFYNNRGQAYAAMGRFDNAETDYLEAIAHDSFYAEPHHNLGSLYHVKRLYDRAIEEYSKAISIRKDDAVFYSNRGLSFSDLGRFDNAIADYMKAIALKPNFAEAYVGIGVVNGKLGRFAAAVEDFTRALSLDSSNTAAYFNRAVAYARMQNIGMALADFQRACEMGDARGCEGANAMRKK